MRDQWAKDRSRIALLTLSGFHARIVAAKNAVTVERSKFVGDSVFSADFLVVCRWASLAENVHVYSSNIFC